MDGLLSGLSGRYRGQGTAALLWSQVAAQQARGAIMQEYLAAQSLIAAEQRRSEDLSWAKKTLRRAGWEVED